MASIYCTYSQVAQNFRFSKRNILSGTAFCATRSQCKVLYYFLYSFGTSCSECIWNYHVVILMCRQTLRVKR